MKNDLVETVKFCFTGEVIQRLGRFVDEPETGIENGLSIAVPLVLNRLLRQPEHGVAPAALLDLVRDADAAEVLAQLADPQNATWYERGANLLLDMLGTSYRSTVNQIAVDAGIRPGASGTLLQIATTAVLGVLGKFATENDLTPTEFINWLHSQKDTISAAILPTAGPGPLVPPSPAMQRQPAATPPRMATAPARMLAPQAEILTSRAAPSRSSAGATGLRWQWGVLLLVAVSLGYFLGRDYFGQARQLAALPVASPTAPVATAPTTSLHEPMAAPQTAATAEEPTVTTTTLAANTATAAPVSAAAKPPVASRPTPVAPLLKGGRYDIDRDTYVYDTGRPIVLTLANGSTQKVGANSTENRLYTFLATAAVQVDSVNRTKGWINLDRVYFEPGSATLKTTSWPQLHNIANILRTFPNATVKLGGYTDSVGVALTNLELSDARAQAAMVALVNLGVPLARLQAKGYGARYFVAPNNTPANRALNRRVSIRVVKK